MCGITGFIGRRVDLAKLKLIAVWNDERGKHSCGIYYDKKVFHGDGQESKITSFLTTHVLPSKLENPGLILAHSRFATMGAHDKGNAHPIRLSLNEGNLLVNKKEGETVLVGVHNGKIINWYDMRDKNLNEMPYLEFNTDTKVLMGLLYLNKENPEKILSNYRGAASLLYTYDEKTLHIFRGAAGDKEERPLHFIEMPEGYYFSSMAEPLLAIRTKDTQKVLIASPNTLYTFTQKEGIVSKVIIPREKGMDEEEVKIYNTKKKINEVNYVGKNSKVKDRRYPHLDDQEEDDYHLHGEFNMAAVPRDLGNSLREKNSNLTKIEDLDRMVKGEMLGDLDFKYFRYTNAGKPLNGEYKLTDDGQIHSAGFPYWFFEGIMVSAEGYLEIARKMIETHDDIFALVTQYSRYPIFAKEVFDCFRNRESRNLMVYRGEIFSGSVAPAFYSHSYIIEEGKVTGKKARKVDESFFYVDQVWKKDVKTGMLSQTLKVATNNKEANEQEKAPDDSSDESETGSCCIVKPINNETPEIYKMQKALDKTQDEVKELLEQENKGADIEERLQKIIEKAGETEPEISEEVEITDSTAQSLEQMSSDEIPEDYLITLDKEELDTIFNESLSKLRKKINKVYREFRDIEEARDALGYGVTTEYLNNLTILEHAKETVALHEQQ